MRIDGYLFGDPKLPPAFWRNVAVQDNGCWDWTGKLDQHGYGSWYFPGLKATIGAYKAAFIALMGPYEEECLDHLCRNRACVNPLHLEPVSIGENFLRGEGLGAKRKRQKVCKRGHPLEGENLKMEKKRNGKPHRRCRICTNARAMESYYRRMAKKRSANV